MNAIINVSEVTPMLQGIAVSQGIGLGQVMLLQEQSLYFDPSRPIDPNTELERLKQAVGTFCRNTARQAEQLHRSAGCEGAHILESHIEMISDPGLQEELAGMIGNGICAETALQTTCDRYIETFSESHDELTRLRAADIRDMCHALLCVLLGVEDTDLCGIPKDTILVTKELSPSVMAGIDREHIVGIVTERGGQTSHAAILARALGVPAVCGVAGAMQALAGGGLVIVDGSLGEVICSPAAGVIADYSRRRDAFLARRQQMEHFRDRKTQAASGETYSLYANITMPCGAARAVEAGAEGIGLFRTEYLFMNREVPPDEQEQYTAYAQAVQGAGGRPVVVRILDIGGDKQVPCLEQYEEDNPFLGTRGIRWCLGHREVFLTQLRALLRAGEGQDLRILLPMVTTVEEVLASRSLLAEAAAQLEAQGVPHAESLPLGVMIETPAAAVMAAHLAAVADFFSIGTNDLTGYLMACDRGNPRVAGLHSALQPAVLWCLRHIIRCGAGAGIPVSICGEAAADPRLIPLLMAFGVSSFSVSAAMVVQVRGAISRWSRAETKQLAVQALGLATEGEVARLMAKAVGEE